MPRRALFHQSGVFDDGSATVDVASTADVAVVAGALTAHLGDTSDAHDASAISFSPTGTIASTDVQAAIAEVASEAGSGGSVTYGTPSLTLGTSNAAGSTDESIRRDATILAFDATVPSTQAFGDSAAAGSAGVAARRDHKHAMPTVEGAIHAATGKTTPDDADEFGIVDSAASNVLKKLSGTNLKAFLKTYFDTLYASSSGSAPIGTPELIYRYTVTGSDKASIDTGADTPDAGSNDFSNGDLLEIFMYLRTDEAVSRSDIDVTFNNDANTSHYFFEYMRFVNTTAAGINGSGQPGWEPRAPGASYTASVFSSISVFIPNYLGTVGFKAGNYMSGETDGGTGAETIQGDFMWNQTSAISRVAITPHTSGKKLKVGSQLLIYKRRSA